MTLSKRIIAFFFSFAILVSSITIPASAVTAGEIITGLGYIATLWEVGSMGYEAWQALNPDKDISEYPGFNPGGMFGDGFGADRTEAEEAYNTYVSNLQTDLGTASLGYDNDGAFIEMLLPTRIGYHSSLFSDKSVSESGAFLATFSGQQIREYSGGTFSVNVPSFSVPIDCRFMTYQFNGNHNFPNIFSGSIGVPKQYYLSPLTKGSTVSVDPGIRFKYYTDSAYLPANLFCSFEVVGRFYLPLNESYPTSQDITINSRPTSITGDYGIIGDNGTITKVDGNVIVDESSSTVYNPVTNTTTNFTNWSYDYSDRSYNLTTEAGDTITVTYGDENITINEGDTIYNVYYVIPQEQPSDPGTDPGTDHTHTYTDEITKQPTCLLSGVRTYTCSCGDSYTKTVPATGHDWQISQQVPNTYDPETGEQTQAGYTVYTCATCGEQYKSTDGTAPPNSSAGDDSSGGIGGVLSGLLGAVGDVIAGLIEGALTLATKAMEALTGLGDLVSQMIETVLGFFGGFIDFMAAMFPFLPEETFTILNLGLILMIAAAVFRKFLN